MNELFFTGTIKADFHVYRVHGDGGDASMGVEPEIVRSAEGRELFHSTGGRDVAVVCDSEDQVVDLTISYLPAEPETSLVEDRAGYAGRLWSSCEQMSALLDGPIMLRNDREDLGYDGSVQIGFLEPGTYGVRLLSRATSPGGEPPVQHILRVWPLLVEQSWQTARMGYPPVDEVTWE